MSSLIDNSGRSIYSWTFQARYRPTIILHDHAFTPDYFDRGGLVKNSVFPGWRATESWTGEGFLVAHQDTMKKVWCVVHVRPRFWVETVKEVDGQAITTRFMGPFVLVPDLDFQNEPRRAMLRHT